MFVRFLHCKFPFLPAPFYTCTFWEVITMCNPHLRRGGIYYWILLHKIFALFSMFYLFNHYQYHYRVMDILCFGFSSVQFNCSVVSDSLWPHELQHARPPCPSPAPRVHSNSRPSSQWCHPAISSSVIPFSSCAQSLLASESFPMSQLFTWGGQSTGVSALASVLPKKSQGWSPSEWTGYASC